MECQWSQYSWPSSWEICAWIGIDFLLRDDWDLARTLSFFPFDNTSEQKQKIPQKTNQRTDAQLACDPRKVKNDCRNRQSHLNSSFSFLRTQRFNSSSHREGSVRFSVNMPSLSDRSNRVWMATLFSSQEKSDCTRDESFVLHFQLLNWVSEAIHDSLALMLTGTESFSVLISPFIRAKFQRNLGEIFKGFFGDK